MAYRVVWSTTAIDDLESIAQYISADSSVYATAVVNAVLKTTQTLSHFPFAGRMVPELSDDSIREKFVYSYRVIYRIEGSLVTIAAVVHGRRLLADEELGSLR
jgi:toxin ParE1/3/4